MTKTCLLGTAQWGWTIAKEEAFKLLDAWLAAGLRGIDCATNYPINRVKADFRASERILCDYTAAHGLRDLKVTMKIGGLDNMRSPEPNLQASFIQMMGGEYQQMMGSNLDCMMLHWDNRTDENAITESLEALARLQTDQGIRPGLSGIKHPGNYAKALKSLDLDCDIQIKHNLLHSDLPRYQAIFFPEGSQRYFAYGINAGGLKLAGQPYPSDSTFLARGGQTDIALALQEKLAELLPRFNQNQQRPAIESMNQLGMVYAGLNPGIHGLIMGVSNTSQLAASLAFWKSLGDLGYEDVYAALLER